MIGTASCGPKANISAGISMMDAPKPTMPERVPAAMPSASTASHIIRLVRCYRRIGSAATFITKTTLL